MTLLDDCFAANRRWAAATAARDPEFFTRLEAEGYGAEHPVCAANDTDECKAQNRRIALRVTAK